jgi:hypothetical protein
METALSDSTVVETMIVSALVTQNVMKLVKTNHFWKKRELLKWRWLVW